VLWTCCLAHILIGEPESTPDQVRGRLSPEYAQAGSRRSLRRASCRAFCSHIDSGNRLRSSPSITGTLLPGETRDYVKIITGRTVEEWVKLRSNVGAQSVAAGSAVPCHEVAFAMVRVAAALPKGRSPAAQAALATLVDEAKPTGVVQKAIDAKGLKGVDVATK